MTSPYLEVNKMCHSVKKKTPAHI